jgi:ParB family transcriptional regulator, chromosome partitioning protein
MAGSKKQFIRRSTLPSVASASEFEERFARQMETRRHHPADLPIDSIDPSPFQIRRRFDGIDELAEAMRMHGFTSRLWVREHPSIPGRFQLVFGERRLRAARAAGIQVIPCEVTQFDDRELLEIGLTENLQREDLDPVEEAEGLQRFTQEFGYSVRELAARIGKDKGYVENRLRLLRLPPDVRQMVSQRPEAMSAAREVARLSAPEARAPLIEGLVNDGLSLKVTHAIVDEALATPEQAQSVVTKRVAAARRSGPRARGTAEVVSDRLTQELDHSWATMVTTIQRWEHRLPELTDDQRERLQRKIDRLVSALEALARRLK